MSSDPGQLNCLARFSTGQLRHAVSDTRRGHARINGASRALGDDDEHDDDDEDGPRGRTARTLSVDQKDALFLRPTEEGGMRPRHDAS